MIAREPILTAPDVSIVQRRGRTGSTVLSDYWALTKPDVNALIVITTAAAFYEAWPAGLPVFPWTRLLHCLLGTACVAAGAATLNQWMERELDARMRRTARRPIAAGRIDALRALRFGVLSSLAGVTYLTVVVGPPAARLAAITLLSYLFVYTPLKRCTPLSVAIGAIPGAIPPLIGWAAARGRLDAGAWALFAIVFLWQLPHFMAIAWMYRDDYDRAGYVVLPRGRWRVPLVVVQTLAPLVALVPASLLPVLAGDAHGSYTIGASVLGLGFLYSGMRFARRRSSQAARQLLLASIVYLPALLALMTLCKR
jgi:protoheme IX farnesyltransferase